MTLPRLRVRTTRFEDLAGIIELSERIYGEGRGWRIPQLESHLRIFPEGQFVAVLPAENGGEQIVGMTASLILKWERRHLDRSWREITSAGMFTDHDQRGMTLYGAEVMADPTIRRHGIGSSLYKARDRLMQRLALKRIRAGSRLRGYNRVAKVMSAESYVVEVVTGKRRDPTLSFQLRRGFEVIKVIDDYLRDDAESLGWAAVIDRLNPEMTLPDDRAAAMRWRKRVLGR